jgi:anti-sigma regulatory factor (Ser/Thr protein kinase)
VTLPSRPGPGHLALELPADPQVLASLCALVKSYAASQGMPPRDCDRLELAVDEVCSNVVCHAFPGDPGHRFRVTMERAGDQVVVAVYDDGPGFEPQAIPPPDIRCPLEERQIGGLGLFLVHKTMDRVEYQREAGTNCMVLAKTIAPMPSVAEA